MKTLRYLAFLFSIVESNDSKDRFDAQVKSNNNDKTQLTYTLIWRNSLQLGDFDVKSKALGFRWRRGRSPIFPGSSSIGKGIQAKERRVTTFFPFCLIFQIDSSIVTHDEKIKYSTVRFSCFQVVVDPVYTSNIIVNRNPENSRGRHASPV